MRNLTLFLFFLFCVTNIFAQIPENYYANAENKSGSELRAALHYIVKNHSSVSYSELWQSFYTTDVRPDNGKVWDIYSDNPETSAQYYFTFGTNQCGNYSSEGDCYNREHSVPKSWFGGNVPPMYTDLFHLYPTDGYVNGKRGNLPLGEITNASWISSNGSKVGQNSYPGYSGQVFEPIDSFKGDLARTYLYMSLCYSDKNLGVEAQSMFEGGELKPWAKQMLIEWCIIDPVSSKERARNEAVYQIQHNRNPFIDFPELAEMVFGNDTNSVFVTSVTDYFAENLFNIYPNPAENYVFLVVNTSNSENFSCSLYDITGKLVLAPQEFFDNRAKVDISNLNSGLYLLKAECEGKSGVYKILKQ